MQYRYTTFQNLYIGNLDDTINEYASAGWRLVAMHPAQSTLVREGTSLYYDIVMELKIG